MSSCVARGRGLQVVGYFPLFVANAGERQQSCLLDFYFMVVQITGETVGEVKAVANMHQRKAEMARHSDAFIALPG